MIIEVHYIDHGAQGEYGLLGKLVARSLVSGWSDEAIEAEIAEMKTILGSHVQAVKVEEIPAVRS